MKDGSRWTPAVDRPPCPPVGAIKGRVARPQVDHGHHRRLRPSLPLAQRGACRATRRGLPPGRRHRGAAGTDDSGALRRPARSGAAVTLDPASLRTAELFEWHTTAQGVRIELLAEVESTEPPSTFGTSPSSRWASGGPSSGCARSYPRPAPNCSRASERLASPGCTSRGFAYPVPVPGVSWT